MLALIFSKSCLKRIELPPCDWLISYLCYYTVELKEKSGTDGEVGDGPKTKMSSCSPDRFGRAGAGNSRSAPSFSSLYLSLNNCNHLAAHLGSSIF